jgi:hypothetical protein
MKNMLRETSVVAATLIFGLAVFGQAQETMKGEMMKGEMINVSANLCIFSSLFDI